MFTIGLGTPVALPGGWIVISETPVVEVTEASDLLIGPGANLAGANLTGVDLTGLSPTRTAPIKGDKVGKVGLNAFQTHRNLISAPMTIWNALIVGEIR